MAGELLLKLKDLNIFRPTVMDSIVNEFEPEPNQYLFTDTFLPFKEVDNLDVIDMIKFGGYGKTYPVRLGADHMRIELPGFAYKQYGSGHWREGMIFNEEVLLRAVNPAAPLTRMAEGLVTDALNLLDVRISNLIERVSMDLVLKAMYKEDRWGTNYTFNPNIPYFRYIDITKSSGNHQVRWTTGNTWDTAAACTPLEDIKQAVMFFRKLGYETVVVWINDITAAKIEASTEFQTLMKLNQQLVRMSIENEELVSLLTGLKGVKIKIDSRIYHDESRISATSAASDTTLYVEDSSVFAANDDIVIKSSATGMNEYFNTITSAANNAIVIGANSNPIFNVGDRVVATRKLLPTNYLVFQGQKNNRLGNNNWVSVPSLVKSSSISSPQPGRYTWNHFDTDRPPYNLEVGAGISGGPKISEANWMVMRVSATTNGVLWPDE